MQSGDDDGQNQEKRVRVIDTAFQRTQKHQPSVKEKSSNSSRRKIRTQILAQKSDIAANSRNLIPLRS